MKLQESVPRRGELQGNLGSAGCREPAPGSWAGMEIFHENRAQGAALLSHRHLEGAPRQETLLENSLSGNSLINY